MLPLLQETNFPSLIRRSVSTLQVNLGYKCNQSCLHCHVNAGPRRKEQMDAETLDLVIDVLSHHDIQTLDLTGGAPELNPHFRNLIERTRAKGVHVIDRCNLTILLEPDQADTAEFLANNQVEVVASLPCYLEENVDAQRGKNVHQGSILGLKKLNALGYGQPGSGLALNLVYNPTGPSLPPSQEQLQADYERELKARYGIVFNQLFTIANMPIARFGSTLVSTGGLNEYMDLLRSAHQDQNLDHVMCLDLISVDYLGYLYDCDFNQMLGMNIRERGKRLHLRDLSLVKSSYQPIAVAEHCYGCTAGRGSSCGGALK
jgi:radical SAM/Cys-rich protein